MFRKDIEMTNGPTRKDRRRFSYDEGTDEAPALIEREATDIQREAPIDDTDPVEQVEEEADTISPMYEESEEK